MQVINRNLMLVFSGQKDGLVPIETKRLHRVEAAIFEGDKFAFEMIHFVKSKRVDGDGTDSMANVWDTNFSRGIETLLVECAIVQDEIERDCFISRIYCWFSEKLAERRELPRNIGRGGLDSLRKSIKDLDASGTSATHTLKGLDEFVEPESTTKALEEKEVERYDGPEPPTIELPVQVPDRHPKFGHRKIPIYVKHAYPNLFDKPNEYEQFLPRIPGAGDNYGMMYHQPESEGEKAMHDLWLAKRQQEAFNWKSQQHMAIVMDRYSLHKSRLESDSLRRQESNMYLQTQRMSDSTGRGRSGRPFSADEASSRFSGMSRPTSSNVSKLDKLKKSYSVKSLGARTAGPRDMSPSPSPERPGESTIDHGFSRSNSGLPLDSPQERTEVHMTVKNNQGVEEEKSVPLPSRETVEKASSKKNLPMRYKLDAPEQFKRQYDTNRYYLQLSDSDDDDKPPVQLKATAHKKGGANGKKGKKDAGKGGTSDLKFKRSAPVVRERPVSAAKFRDVSTNDSEFKIHYRHTNYRRMPLTQKQEEWLAEKEYQREQKSLDMAKALQEAKDAKKDKGKGDKGGKDDKGKGKDKKGAAVEEVKPPPKYKSAAQYMSVAFPDFENDEDNDAHGPMRMIQLLECARTMGCVNEWKEKEEEAKKNGTYIKPFSKELMAAKLRKALVIPQDKPEAISLENMRQDETEGLMVNPLPPERHRSTNFSTGKKGKKKK